MRRGWDRWLAVAAAVAALSAMSLWAWTRGAADGLGLLWTVLAGAAAVLAPAAVRATRSSSASGDLTGYVAMVAESEASPWRTEEANRGMRDGFADVRCVRQ